MNITFLGTGDAFSFDNRHNSAFLEFENTNLFIDFPCTNRTGLRLINKELDYVENLFITHLHEDHINGVQQLAYYKEILKKDKPNLYIYEGLLEEFWSTVRTGLEKTTKGRKTIEHYFNIYPIKNSFKIQNQTFYLQKTDHVPEMNSFGLIVDSHFYFSGDSNVNLTDLEHIIKMYNVKTIFHDCHLWDLDIASHASLKDIQSLPKNIRDTIILMHYHDGYYEEHQKVQLEGKESVSLVRSLHPYTF